MKPSEMRAAKERFPLVALVALGAGAIASDPAMALRDRIHREPESAKVSREADMQRAYRIQYERALNRYSHTNVQTEAGIFDGSVGMSEESNK